MEHTCPIGNHKPGPCPGINGRPDSCYDCHYSDDFRRPYILYSPAAGSYVRAWQRVINACHDPQDPQVIFIWDYREFTPQAARAEFLKALHARINARAGRTPAGRDDSPEYMTRAGRDQRAIRDRILSRVRVYHFETQAARRRFAHLLSRYDED